MVLFSSILLPEDWDFLQQYENDFQDLYDYVIFCQHLYVRIHEELMELRGTLSKMLRPYFEMRENILKKRGDDLATDLTDRPLNQLVAASTFEFQNDLGENILITPGTTYWIPLREAVELLSVS